MSLIVDQEGYQYFALGLATVAFLPQLYTSFKKKSMEEVSGTTLCCVTISGGLWGVYMYEKELPYFAIATFFVTICTTTLLFMKFSYYCLKLRQHFSSIDTPPAPIVLQTTNNV